MNDFEKETIEALAVIRTKLEYIEKNIKTLNRQSSIAGGIAGGLMSLITVVGGLLL